MSNIQNQKSGLAKLMATENLTVQHAKTHTASFDPKRRILTVPIWEKTSPELYDLLVGHEVGHAIDTPRDGWHGAVHKRGANYKGFLNVVEDARIEKRQKRRYPGLRRSFVIGFNELMGRDFFGLNGRDINSMTFIDRLNVYSKSGYTLDNIQFNKKEQDYVRRVQQLETWDDVLKLTNEIWDYSKDEQFQLNMPQDYEYEFTDEDGEGEEVEIDGEKGDTQTDGKGKMKAKAKSDGEDGEQSEGSSSGDGDESKDGDDGEDGNTINRFKDSQATRTHQEPRCETDENYRRNEMTLIDKKARDYVYVSPPTPNLKNIITPAKRVQELLTKEFTTQTNQYETHANTLYNTFRKKNERYIALLAKEFEMRKAASKFSKAKTAETGDLDIGKIFKYQIDDNIFKRVMKVPKGKSHGLVLLLDKSGSMSDNLSASYEQILILAMFCRKVNIPFTAYGFGNQMAVRDIDYPNTADKNKCFESKQGELEFDGVYLREMINSNMGNGEFTKAVKNILCLSDAWKFSGYYRHAGLYFSQPESDGLSNTPLTEALVACQPILNEFRKQNNLDIVNLCVVHDGDADDTNRYVTAGGGRGYANARYTNVVFTDKKAKIQIDVSGGDDSMRIAVAKWLTETTGAKIIGFYLAPDNQIKSAIRHRLFNEDVDSARKLQQKNMYDGNVAMSEVYNKYAKILRKEKFVESKNPGYESFFIIPGDDALSVNDAEFDTDVTSTAALTKAFGKYTKSRQVNRVLVSRFIGMIAV
jgi:hypothetical protein